MITSLPIFYISQRFLSAREATTALRSFYKAVHPDLFVQYPHQQVHREHLFHCLEYAYTFGKCDNHSGQNIFSCPI